MGKSKKRNRTKALYEAAAAAKRLMLQTKEDLNGVIEAEVGIDRASVVRMFHSSNKIQNEGKKSSPAGSLGGIKRGTAPSQQTQQQGEDEDQQQPTPSDIATTLRTVRYLARFRDIFLHSKDYKELRGALHPLVTERLKSYDKGIDYRQRVTVHLSHRRWSAAMSSLSAAKDFRQFPKQGTIQRWVRDVDQCEDGPVKIKLLTMILGCNTNGSGNGTNPAICGDDDEELDDENGETKATDGTNKHDPALALIEAQKSLDKLKAGNNSEFIGEGSNTNISKLKVLEGWKITPSPSSPTDKTDDDNGAVGNLQKPESRIVYRENASERTPPNRYDLLLHATEASAVLPLEAGTISHGVVTKHEVPFLAGAFALENVLSSDECSRLVEVASILGYRPDHPSHLPSPTGIDSCEWLVDDSIHDLIYDRVREHLPRSMGQGASGNSDNSNSDSNISSNNAYNNESNSNGGSNKKGNTLCGINKRWRFFRYGQDCVYRPHIDGSWPAGSLSEDGNSYELDKSGRTRSYLTFLIYLNDGFEGGETRFFYPEKEGSTSLAARGIVPHKGSVLVFPQGNTASLLHEGSAVTKGTKYVVRTDVLYKH